MNREKSSNERGEKTLSSCSVNQSGCVIAFFVRPNAALGTPISSISRRGIGRS